MAAKPAKQSHQRFDPQEQCSDDKLKEYRPRAVKLGLTLEIKGTRWKWWELRDPGAFLMTTGFDVDLNTALNQVSNGKKLADVTLWGSSRGTPVGRGDIAVATTCASPSGVCAFCGSPGGVPCPKMIQKALQIRLMLKDPTALNLHPGRCRAAVKKSIETSQVKK